MEQQNFDDETIPYIRQKFNCGTKGSPKKDPKHGHFTRDRILHAIRARIDWPGVAKDVKELCASCLICQKAGPAVTTKAPLHPLSVMKEPFARVAMDVFGPLSRTKTGNKYILVLMEYSTKWPEAFALRNVTTETVFNFLAEVTARIGVPEELLSDNGSNFISKVMQQYSKVTGIKQTEPPHTILREMVWWRGSNPL